MTQQLFDNVSLALADAGCFMLEFSSCRGCAAVVFFLALNMPLLGFRE